MPLATEVLTQVDHLAAYSVEPPGVLVMRHHYHHGMFVSAQIRRADPEVKFSWELLHNIATGFDPNLNDGVIYPYMNLVPRYEHNPAECRTDGPCLNSALLYIDADGRRVVYRIGAYNPRKETWTARWPD